jgi:hypothetical protein
MSKICISYTTEWIEVVEGPGNHSRYSIQLMDDDTNIFEDLTIETLEGFSRDLAEIVTQIKARRKETED